MEVIDLSHPISPRMPVYPGTEPPQFTTGCSIEENGFLEQKVSMFTHTGTHIDAPAHIIKDGETLDGMSLDLFFGDAFLVNLAGMEKTTVNVNKLEPYGDVLERSDFLLVQTGWSRYWGTDQYFKGYPVLSEEAAAWLTGFRLKGLGLDTLSADGVESRDFQVHQRLLSRGMIIIENLTNLHRVPCSRFRFSCLPLSFEGADGSPVRAVAIVEE